MNLILRDQFPSMLEGSSFFVFALTMKSSRQVIQHRFQHRAVGSELFLVDI